MENLWHYLRCPLLVEQGVPRVTNRFGSGDGGLRKVCRTREKIKELKAETLLHFTDVHRYVPLRVRSATSALAFPTDCRPWLPEVVPRFLATMAAPTPSKASMAHSPDHPSTGLQRSCLLTPMVWFRRRVPIDPIRSLRNPDHPGGNPGQSPAPAHRACFVWPASQVRSTMVAIPVPCGTTGQPV